MNRQELLRTAEELRETRDITAAVVKNDWGADDEPVIEVRSDFGFTVAVQSLIRDGFLAGPDVEKNDDGETVVRLTPAE